MRQYRNVHDISLVLSKGLLVLFRKKPQVLLVALLAIFILVRGCSSWYPSTVSFEWDRKNLDVATNGNLTLSLKLLQSNTGVSAIKPLESDVFHSPLTYLGKYLQISGTVQSAKQYTPQGGLNNLLISNSSEVIVLGDDGTTIFDVFLLTSTQLTPGSNITVYGYTPGLRYIQNTQGLITPTVLIIGRLNPY